MTEKNFSIIIIPDTQNLSFINPDKLENMVDWIKNNSEKINLKFVLHVGDVVNHGASEIEAWNNHKLAFKRIENANIPILFAIGNHDYDNLLQTDRSSKVFNKYSNITKFKESSWYGGMFENNKMENVYAKMKISDLQFLFLILEFGPRDEVLKWANGVLADHPGHQVIVVTHSYMYIHGKRTKIGDEYNPKIYQATKYGNDGEEIWQKCLKWHKNITAVYSGHHVNTYTSYRFDYGKEGNKVFQSFQNWQAANKGGCGRIRVLNYDLESQKVDVRVFNPDEDIYEQEEGYETSYFFNQ